MLVEFSIPGPVPSAANMREHWRARHRRTKAQRFSACMAAVTLVRAEGLNMKATGGVVTLTRVSPRPLDSDNLASSLKAHRDGIADALGVDDGDPRIEWRYEQAKCGKGQQALRVVVEPIERRDP